MERRKNRYSALLLVFIFMTSCLNKHTAQVDKNNTNIEAPMEESTTLPKFYINIDSLFINKDLKFIGDKEDLTKALGKPDSIKENEPVFDYHFEQESYLGFYSQTQVEMTNNKYGFIRLYLANSITEINYKDIIFSSDYDTIQFFSDFPELRKELRESNFFNIKEEKIVEILACEECDSMWRFVFIEGRLKLIWYFIPS